MSCQALSFAHNVVSSPGKWTGTGLVCFRTLNRWANHNSHFLSALMLDSAHIKLSRQGLQGSRSSSGSVQGSRTTSYVIQPVMVVGNIMVIDTRISGFFFFENQRNKKVWLRYSRKPILWWKNRWKTPELSRCSGSSL